jgi:diguanylate cyclase (GGDEF)-like protein
VAAGYLVLLAVGLSAVTFNPLGGTLLGAVLLALLVTTRHYVTLRDYGRLAARYRDLAAIDGVTGLFNRRHFMETAEAAFARAQRLGQPFTAVMIDVDNFKQINEQHGHAAGDQVLAGLAQACREHARPDDLVGRYGGDELIIMVPGITSLRAIQLADQLTRPLSSARVHGGRRTAFRVSVGIAESSPDSDLSVLLMHADLALYQAKQAGGGAWRIFGDAARAEQAPAAPAPAAAGNG